MWQAAKELRAKLPPPPFYERYPSEELFLEHQKIQMKLFLDRQATNLAIFRLQKKVHEYKSNKLMEQVNRNTQDLEPDLFRTLPTKDDSGVSPWQQFYPFYSIL
ncbi:hypothetical protein A2U01_0069870, partial [Trifolium medium]|nr:hypothetical protein [Trifolium medium]